MSGSRKGAEARTKEGIAFFITTVTRILGRQVWKGAEGECVWEGIMKWL